MTFTVTHTAWMHCDPPSPAAAFGDSTHGPNRDLGTHNTPCISVGLPGEWDAPPPSPRGPSTPLCTSEGPASPPAHYVLQKCWLGPRPASRILFSHSDSPDSSGPAHQQEEPGFFLERRTHEYFSPRCSPTADRMLLPATDTWKLCLRPISNNKGNDDLTIQGPRQKKLQL